MQEAPVPQMELTPTPHRGRGRPAIITLPLVQEVAKLIAKGMTEEQACLRVGINHGSFRTARHRNPEFDTAIKETHAQFLDESIDIIAKGGRGWQGRAWILERRHGDQFRRTSGLEVSAQIGPFAVADVLVRKSLHQWTKMDVDQSVGAWKLLKKWTQEQLRELMSLYARHWGPMDGWSDEQLEWAVEIEKAMRGTPTQENGEVNEETVVLEALESSELALTQSDQLNRSTLLSV
jgi:hypothetical protein